MFINRQVVLCNDKNGKAKFLIISLLKFYYFLMEADIILGKIAQMPQSLELHDTNAVLISLFYGKYLKILQSSSCISIHYRQILI